MIELVIILGTLEGNVAINTYLMSVIGILSTVLWFFIQNKMKSYEKKITDLEDAVEQLEVRNGSDVSNMNTRYDKMNDKIHEINMEVLRQVNAITREISEFKVANLK